MTTYQPSRNDESILVPAEPGCMGSACAAPSRMNKVGAGKGDYALVELHNYVGPGQGDWEKREVEQYYGCRPRRGFLVAVLCGLLLLTVIIVVITATVNAVNAGGTDGPRPSPNPASSYDCNEGFESWNSSWSIQQKDWCCRNRGRACPTTQRPNQMDCKDGRVNWQHGWSEAKKDWCCGWARQGCRELEYDCTEGYADWEHEWSEEQKEYCCQEHNRGCRLTTTAAPTNATHATRPPANPHNYVCRARDNNWRTEWSEDKKNWCCNTTGLGCPTHLDPDSRCATICEYKNFSAPCGDRVKWFAQNAAKDVKDACAVAHHTVLRECPVCAQCTLADTGCEDNDPDDYDCDTGLEDVERYWSVAKQAWCCLNEKKGCGAASRPAGSPAAAAPPATAYDCNAGFAHWESGWSDAKKDHCCHTVGRGCKKPVHDCNAGYSNWRTSWSVAKKAWCCHQVGRGCAEFTGPSPYDCNAGFSHWVSGWSVGKKDWCCQQIGRGCTTTPEPR